MYDGATEDGSSSSAFEQEAAVETDPACMTLGELEFGEALVGLGGVVSLSSRLRPKAAALWQARRRTGHTTTSEHGDTIETTAVVRPLLAHLF